MNAYISVGSYEPLWAHKEEEEEKESLSWAPWFSIAHGHMI